MSQSIDEALLGSAPTAADIPAIADALRRRRTLGQIGIASGLPNLASVGKGLTDEADQQGQDLQMTRQRDNNLQEAKDRSAQQNTQFGLTLGEDTRAHKADEALRRAEIEAQLEIARNKVLDGNPNVEARNMRSIESQMQAYSQRLDKDSIPQLETAMKAFQDAVAPYAAKGKGIPGMGGLENFPIVAKAHGLISPDAADIYGKLSSVRNIILHSRFGARLTQAEINRLMEEMGGNVMYSEKNDLSLYGNLVNQLEAQKKSLASGLDRGAIAAYRANKGEVLDDEGNAALENARNGKLSIGLDGKVGVAPAASAATGTPKRRIKFSDLPAQ